MDNSKHLTCEEDIFKWSGTVEELQELVNYVLTDMKVHVQNGELTEDKSHKAFTYKCNEYSVRYYQTSKKLKLFGTNSALMDKFYEISAAAKESSAEAVNNEEDEDEDDDDEDEDETDNDLETLRDELDIIKREVSLIKNSLNDKEANSNLTSELQLSQNENEKLRTIIDMQKEEICKLKIESQSLLNVISLLSVPGPRDYYTAPREYTKTFDTVDLTKESTKTKEGNQSKNKTKTKKKQNKSSSDDNHSAASSEQTRKSKQSKATSNSASNKAQDKKNVVILGDSMIKSVQGWKMSKAKRVISRCFPGSTVKDMVHYVKPTLERNPDELIIHVGTNDLVSKDAETVIKEMTNLASQVRSQCSNTKITFSSIIARNDEKVCDSKVQKVNDMMKQSAIKNNWSFIDNSNITKDCLNQGGLHLNKKGSGKLIMNLITYIKSIDV